MLQASGHGRAPAVLGQWQFGHAPADFARVHDLVRFAFLENAVLMDARSVRKGVFADDGLVARHEKTAHARNEPRRLYDLARADAGVEAVVKIVAGLQSHYDLLERSVASPLADAVD